MCRYGKVNSFNSQHSVVLELSTFSAVPRSSLMVVARS